MSEFRAATPQKLTMSEFAGIFERKLGGRLLPMNLIYGQWNGKARRKRKRKSVLFEEKAYLSMLE